MLNRNFNRSAFQPLSQFETDPVDMGHLGSKLTSVPTFWKPLDVMLHEDAGADAILTGGSDNPHMPNSTEMFS